MSFFLAPDDVAFFKAIPRLRARSVKAPLHTHNNAAIHVSVTQNRRQIWIHRRDSPLLVATSDVIEERVMDCGGMSVPENLT